MRFWFEALAEPNRIAAQVLTTSPMKVRTLGLMRESASQRTMVSSSTPHARPKALVHEAVIGGASCGSGRKKLTTLTSTKENISTLDFVLLRVLYGSWFV